jgi:pilus assembly protein Flp/PilA
MTILETVFAGARSGLIRFGLDESGATAIEYAMVAAGVSVAIVGAVSSLGSHLKTTFYDKLAALLP